MPSHVSYSADCRARVRTDGGRGAEHDRDSTKGKSPGGVTMAGSIDDQPVPIQIPALVCCS